MLDLFDEFKALIKAFNDADVPYALCGGLAMAVHGFPRATIDIELMILASDLDAALGVVKDCGFTFPAAPMRFAEEKIIIHRMTKIDGTSGDHIMVDLLLVPKDIDDVWLRREKVLFEGNQLWVVDTKGLVRLKEIRGSGTDVDDIKKLQDGREN